ncbi:MAG: glycosyltransferase family 4 protein, partial [Opitutaceae bacterium]|nr:glycosyltransferase family 4 protein [Verrucomicrobiales bacterium]
RRLGHDTLMLPLYLPLTLDEKDQSAGTPIFFSGVNVYLEQKSAFFRHAPNWLHRLLASRWLLNLAGKRAGKTRPEELGDLALSMIQGEQGLQARELEDLVAWLKTNQKPDVISLSNVLLVGMVRRLKQALKAPVVCMLQGEDTFLDSLSPEFRDRCWRELSARAQEVDFFIAPSRYFADLMSERLNISRDRIQVVYNGISLEGYPPSTLNSQPPTPTLGYFARMCRDKGLEGVVQTFIELKRRNRIPNLRLKIGGGCGPSDEPQVAEMKRLLERHNCLDSVSFHPNVDRDQKIEFLHSLTVFCTPALYGEAFGLYVIEAMAAGVPVVQPRHAAFPEIIDATGGGLIAEPNPAALAAAIEELLLNPAKAQAFGESGCKVAHDYFNVERMSRETVDVFQRAGAPTDSRRKTAA